MTIARLPERLAPLVCLLASVSPMALQAQISASADTPPQMSDDRVFNTVRTKLAAGASVVGGTITTSDPDTYCAMAHAGFDFLWIEMQHSTLTYADAARMIWACRDAPAVPFVRVPEASEGDIQKATDMGALGIIIPMVDDVQKIRDAVTFAHYPPLGKRSQGGGQHSAIWGDDYRRRANDNIMIVAMIESPAGVEKVEEISNVEGVDVVFVASTDLGSFTGLPQGDPAYEALVDRVVDAARSSGRVLGGPFAWMTSRSEYRFFQGPTATSLILTGGGVVLKEADPCFGVPSGVAPVAGETPCP